MNHLTETIAAYDWLLLEKNGIVDQMQYLAVKYYTEMGSPEYNREYQSHQANVRILNEKLTFLSQKIDKLVESHLV